jgi:hypothetical protein
MRIHSAFQNQSRRLAASPLFSLGVAAPIGAHRGLAAALGPALAAAARGPVRPMEDPPALASGLAWPAAAVPGRPWASKATPVAPPRLARVPKATSAALHGSAHLLASMPSIPGVVCPTTVEAAGLARLAEVLPVEARAQPIEEALVRSVCITSSGCPICISSPWRTDCIASPRDDCNTSAWTTV